MNPADDIVRCDFCQAGNPDPVYVIVSAPFAFAGPGKLTIASGEWTACDMCMTDLNGNDYAAIFDRFWYRAGAAIPRAAKGEARRFCFQLWGNAWLRRTEVRTATAEDHLAAMRNLAAFRRDYPEAR